MRVGGSERRAMRIGAGAGAAALALALAGGACARPAPLVARVCGRVMGLSSGEAHFVACTQALSGAQARVDRGRALAWARRTCLDSGLRPGDAQLGVCELRRAAQAPATPEAAADLGPPARSYFVVSNAEVFRRVRLACAEIGLDPTEPAYGACQTGLQAALFNADNPAH